MSHGASRAAFATPNSSSGIDWDDGSTSILKRLVKSAGDSGKGTKIVLSIGEGTGYVAQITPEVLMRDQVVGPGATGSHRPSARPQIAPRF